MPDFKRVFVSVPPTDRGAAVVARGAAIARATGAQLRLASCVYDPYIAGERFSDSPELSAAREELVAERHSTLEALAAPIREGGDAVSVEAFWAYPVYEGIVSHAAAWDADLVVAGTFAHSLVQRIGLGNTDWQLIRLCKTPLLLVRGEESFSGYQSIIAAVDPVHAHDKPAALDGRIVDAATGLAEVSGGIVQVVHAYFSGQYVPMLAPGAGMAATFYSKQSPEEMHRAALDRLMADRDFDPDRIHLREGDARHVIAELAAESDASLVIMGAVSRSRIHELLVGSTAEAVLDSLPCDVLILKPEE
jgi:universal stress protein E